MKAGKIIIGSRGSDLALWQANHIKSRLEKHGNEVEIKVIKTQGDLIQHLSFEKMEGKGFFTKELEGALKAGEIDLAVHSYKDLETDQPEELIIGAVSERANPADLLLIRTDLVDPNQKWNLRVGANVGTSSARRKMQLLHGRSDLVINDIRGNVPTRIDKLRIGKFDAIVLARAGVDRLGLDLSDLFAYEFDPSEFIPAPAQGVLACQIRAKDEDLGRMLEVLHDAGVAEMVHAERKVLNLFDGGCQLPLGAFCERTQSGYRLRAIMANVVGGKVGLVDLHAEQIEGLAARAASELKKKAHH